MIRGIDVSSLQGRIDWKAERSRFDFVIIRDGYGNEAPDSRAKLNIAEARLAGFVVGTYNVTFPLHDSVAHINRSPVDQARWHARKWQEGDLPPACDLEWPGPEAWAKWQVSGAFIVDWHLRYLEELERVCGVRPMVYTYPYYWQTLTAAAGDAAVLPFNQYPLWLAKYEDHTEMAPVTPYPWTYAEIQQTEGGDKTRLLNGCPVDTNVYLGSEDGWKRLRGLPYEK